MTVGVRVLCSAPWSCNGPVRKGTTFSPHLLAGKFSGTVPGQGWRCHSGCGAIICCIADLLYSPAGMGGAPQSNGAPWVRDPDAVPMAMTSALICPGRGAGLLASHSLHTSPRCVPCRAFCARRRPAWIKKGHLTAGKDRRARRAGETQLSCVTIAPS